MSDENAHYRVKLIVEHVDDNNKDNTEVVSEHILGDFEEDIEGDMEGYNSDTLFNNVISKIG